MHVGIDPDNVVKALVLAEACQFGASEAPIGQPGAVMVLSSRSKCRTPWPCTHIRTPSACSRNVMGFIDWSGADRCRSASNLSMPSLSRSGSFFQTAARNWAACPAVAGQPPDVILAGSYYILINPFRSPAIAASVRLRAPNFCMMLFT